MCEFGFKTANYGWGDGFSYCLLTVITGSQIFMYTLYEAEYAFVCQICSILIATKPDKC